MGKTLLLTPGFRFHPTGVELVKYYLKRKVLGKKFSVEAVTELDIYKHDLWDLPGKSCLKSRELKWYFFCPRERKYASGARINRATESGYWKATGKDRSVTYNDEVVGMIKTLIFHRGRAPSGIRTNWVMHEYRLQDKNLIDIQDSYVLCVIFQKEGPGPRNGAQYGAPFREEEWTDDEEEISVGVGPSLPNSQQPDKGHVASRSQISPNQCLGSSSASCMSGLATPSLKVLQPFSSNDFGHNNSVADRPPSPKCTALGSSLESCASGVVTPSCKLPQPVSNKDIEAEMLPALDESDELSLLYKFADEDSFMVDENDNNKATNNVNQRDAVATGAGRSDATDVFEGLTDLGSNVHKPSSHSLDEVFIGDDNGYFLELRDLCTPLVLPDGPKEDEVPFGQLSATFNCYNSGESSYQANDVDLWSGRARGSEDCYWSNSSIAVQNHTHPWPPEIVHQRAEADTIYGSQFMGLKSSRWLEGQASE